MGKIYWALVLVLMVLFGGCSSDVEEPFAEKERFVSLNVEMKDSQFTTRSTTGVEGHLLRCVLEIWDDELSVLYSREEVASGDNSALDFSFEADNSASYTLLLWADYIDSNYTTSSSSLGGVNYDHLSDKYYTTTLGLQNISFLEDNTSLPSAKDCFFTSLDFTKTTTAMELSATLNRAVSKITFAQKDSEALEVCSNFVASYTTPSTFNVATAKATSSRSVTFSSAPFNGDITINSTPCKTLFYDYILSSSDGVMGEVALEFTSTSAEVIISDVTIPAGLPLLQNYEINCAGNIINFTDLTSNDVSLDVSINENWTNSQDKDDILSDDSSQEPDPDNSGSVVAPDDSGDYILVSTVAQLQTLASEVNGGDTKSGYAYKLSTNLDLSGTQWVAIGNYDNKFYGTFDGGGHTISGLTISSASAFQGLFGYIYLSQIRNLNIEQASVTGSQYVGGVAGKSDYSTIINCSVSGAIIGTEANSYIGSIAGSMNGSSVINCINSATVTASGCSYIGGITASATGGSEVALCLNTGQVTGLSYSGAIVGYANSDCTITTSYALTGCLTTTTGAEISCETAQITNSPSTTLQSNDFVTEINSAIATYNSTLAETKTQACNWSYSQNEYPKLDM